MYILIWKGSSCIVLVLGTVTLSSEVSRVDALNRAAWGDLAQAGRWLPKEPASIGMFSESQRNKHLLLWELAPQLTGMLSWVLIRLSKLTIFISQGWCHRPLSIKILLICMNYSIIWNNSSLAQRGVLYRGIRPIRRWGGVECRRGINWPLFLRFPARVEAFPQAEALGSLRGGTELATPCGTHFFIRITYSLLQWFPFQSCQARGVCSPNRQSLYDAWWWYELRGDLFLKP